VRGPRVNSDRPLDTPSPAPVHRRRPSLATYQPAKSRRGEGSKLEPGSTSKVRTTKPGTLCCFVVSGHPPGPQSPATPFRQHLDSAAKPATGGMRGLGSEGESVPKGQQARGPKVNSYLDQPPDYSALPRCVGNDSIWRGRSAPTSGRVLGGMRSRGSKVSSRTSSVSYGRPALTRSA